MSDPVTPEATAIKEAKEGGEKENVSKKQKESAIEDERVRSVLPSTSHKFCDLVCAEYFIDFSKAHKDPQWAKDFQNWVELHEDRVR